MDRRARRAIAGAVGLLALIGGSVGLTDSLDARLAGAWTTSEADCARLFQRRGGALTFRQPVEMFAQAAIIQADPRKSRNRYKRPTGRTAWRLRRLG